MLDISHISKSFGAFKALDAIDIHVRKGDIFGLMGPNGAGKTTLIRIINRIIEPDEGEVLLNGVRMKDEDVATLGYLPEERGLYKKMKVGDQAVYLAQLKGLSRQDAESRLHEWFARFEIEPWWNRKVEELSKGMQQKVQFITTVLHKPQLIIFDEPFSGFDPVNAELLKDEILRLNSEGATIILSSHNMNSIEELCSHVALLNQSHVVLSGKLDDIKQQYSGKSLSEIFVQTVKQNK